MSNSTLIGKKKKMMEKIEFWHNGEITSGYIILDYVNYYDALLKSGDIIKVYKVHVIE